MLLVGAFQSRQEIAARLGRSEHTVKNHIWRVKKKLRQWLRDRDLALWILQHPEAVYTGFTRDPSWHDPGCPCNRALCTHIRSMDWQSLLAAA